MRIALDITDGGAKRVGCALRVAFCGAALAFAHTAASGQTQSPGAQNRNGTACAAQEPGATAPNTAEAGCQELGPNFATPSAGVLGGTRPFSVTSIIRVDAAVPKPPVAMPQGDSFNVVGSATLVKTRREALPACLAAGKRWSARSGAGTSTTCLDHKGDVIAYQECKASGSSPECTVVMLQQDTARTP